MPHATSKIEAFQDIYADYPSLGFRGEALHSLANLSEKLYICTRTKDDAIAEKMEFRGDGTMVLDAVEEYPRKIGTTVAVMKLLQSIPVRRRDLEQRIKQHRTKLVHLITGYAIFSTGVSINLMDVNGGNVQTVLATASNSAKIQDTVASVLGTKFLATMSTITVDLSQVVGDTKAIAEPTTINSTITGIQWKVEGLVSAAGASREKAKAKEQYFAINRRPVDMPKVARLLNETFRAFGNGDRHPNCVLEFTLPGASYDINLSPDKRQVLLTHETLIYQAVQKAAGELWASQTDGQFQQGLRLSTRLDTAFPNAFDDGNDDDDDDEIGNSSNSRLFHRRYGFVHDPTTAAAKELNDGQRLVEYESLSPARKRRASNCLQDGPHTEQSVVETKKSRVDSLQFERQHPESADIHAKASHSELKRGAHERVSSDTIVVNGTREQLQVDVDMANSTANKVKSPDLSISITPSPVFRVGASVSGRENSCNKQSDDIEHDKLPSASSTAQGLEHSASERWAERCQWQGVQAKFNRSSPEDRNDSKLLSFDRFKAGSAAPSIRAADRNNKQKSVGLERFGFRTFQKDVNDKTTGATLNALTMDPSATRTIAVGEFPASLHEATSTELQPMVASTEQEADSTTLGTTTSSTVWNSFEGTNKVIMATMRDRFLMRDRKRKHNQDTPADIATTSSEFDVSLDAAKTTVSLSKVDFKSMTIVGQFNMGFILTRSQNGNLWILDQHACDEKYTFEKLCNETTIHEQTLIAPMSLELSPSEETCILDHMDIFEKNGFRFSYDETKPPRHRLSLTALPHSGARDGRNAVQYGKDDVKALCSILGSDEDSSAVVESGGTGTDGSGTYGNNAVRRYASGNRSGETADRIIARLPKTIAMFASRACRGSVMIGKALSEKEMDKIVKRLAEIEHPWNCPHGRPTMRHLCDSKPILAADDSRAAEHVAGPTVTLLSQDVDN